MHATTMKTKRHYTAPVTQRATVELEGGFCGSIMENADSRTSAQSHETGFDNRNHNGESNWDYGFTATEWSNE